MFNDFNFYAPTCYYYDGKPGEGIPAITIDYKTECGRGTITINPSKVFPCTVHDTKTIIDILWKSQSISRNI